jgi:hypothetical protein
MPETVRFDLAKLLDPVSPATFFGEHWEEKPLRVKRNRPDYYRPLLSLDEIDPLIALAGLPPDAVSVANVDDVTQGECARADGSIDVVKACQLFSAGATIVLQEAHKWHAPMTALCRGLECEFGAPLQANLYLTPPAGQGFETHYDTHDVLVLQIAGDKEWTIFDSPVRLPLRGQVRPEPASRGRDHDVLRAGRGRPSLHSAGLPPSRPLGRRDVAARDPGGRLPPVGGCAARGRGRDLLGRSGIPSRIAGRPCPP